MAAVHDTSTDMIERHYGAFIVDAPANLLRRAAVSMVLNALVRRPATRQVGGVYDKVAKKDTSKPESHHDPAHR